MNMIIDNWELIVAILSVVACVITNVIYFIQMPNANKVANLKEWLLFAVIEAEKRFGSGTGTIKLRYVYDLACKNFTWLPKMVTFETFSKWVDQALEWAKVQLESNVNIKFYVESKDENSAL